MIRALTGLALTCLLAIPWLQSLWLESTLALLALVSLALVVFVRKDNLMIYLMLMAACPIVPFVKWFEGALSSKAVAAPLRALHTDLDFAERTITQFFLNNDAILHSLAILVAQQDEIDSNLYQYWLGQLLPAQRNQFLNVALSENLVVNHVYPANKENRAVLGVDLGTLPGQGGHYRHATLTHTSSTIGPVMLFQGLPGIVYVQSVAGNAGRLISGVLAFEQLGLALATNGAFDTGMTAWVSGGAENYKLVGDGPANEPSQIRRSLTYNGIKINLAVSSSAIERIIARSNFLTRLGGFGFWLCLSIILIWQQLNLQLRDKQSNALKKNEFELIAAQRLGQMGSWWQDERDLMHLSAPLQELLQYPTADMSLNGFFALLHPDEQSNIKEEIREFTRNNRGHLSLEHRVKIGDNFRWFEHRLAKSKTERYTGSVRDIDNLRKRDEQVAQLESFDSLTGVANRHYFKLLTLQSLALSERRGSHLALLLVNIDDFRAINEKYGQLAGDDFLKQFTQRLLKGSRKSDTVARLSGDTFAVSFVDIAKYQSSALVVEQMLRRLKEPYALARKVYPQLTMGVAMYPDDGQNYDQLLQMAESALSSAKIHARGQYRYYSPTLTEATDRRQKILSSLPYAIRNNHLRLVYQPRVSGRDPKQVLGMEALVRWHDPDLGTVSPGEFIPIAEQSTLISDLGYWVMEQVFAMMAQQQNQLPIGLSVSINLSPKQLEDPNLLATIEQLLSQYSVAASQFELEITEHSVTGRSDEMVDTMRALSALGFTFALDDFGTGYSNLSILQSLPLHVLKVDMSFISAIGTSVKSDELVRAILKMGHGLGLRVVAEGVESADQVNFLTALNCEELQGYYFYKPGAIKDLLEHFNQSSLVS